MYISPRYMESTTEDNGKVFATHRRDIGSNTYSFTTVTGEGGSLVFVTKVVIDYDLIHKTWMPSEAATRPD